MFFFIGDAVNNLAERLNSLKKEWGMNQTAFAELFSVTSMTVSRYITGERVPGSTEIAYFCNHTGVSANWLLLGLGEKLMVDKDRLMASAPDHPINYFNKPDKKTYDLVLKLLRAGDADRSEILQGIVRVLLKDKS